MRSDFVKESLNPRSRLRKKGVDSAVAENSQRSRLHATPTPGFGSPLPRASSMLLGHRYCQNVMKQQPLPAPHWLYIPICSMLELGTPDMRTNVSAIHLDFCTMIRTDRKSQARQCFGFCTAVFRISLAYESAELKPKYCLTWDFLSALTMIVQPPLICSAAAGAAAAIPFTN